MQFKDLAGYFGSIEQTTLRNSKTEILAELFRELTSQEIGQVSYLSVGRLGPLYDPLEFGLAGKMVMRAVAWGMGESVEQVSQLYKAKGDLGEVAELLKHTKAATEDMQGSKAISQVFEELLVIAKDSGKGSQERKVERLGRLLKELDGTSAKYVVRLIMGKLRLGFSDLTILDALSWSATGGKADRAALEHAYNVWSDMGEVARLYKEGGVNGLLALDVVPGRPVKPMRAERLGTVAEIVAKLERLAVEAKYDGMRLQVHAYSALTHDAAPKIQEGLFSEDTEAVTVTIFSRGLEDITHMFPDVVAAARLLHKTAGDFVLDGEALGVDLKTGKFLSFQETITRKRKHGVGEKVSAIPLTVQVFDVLYQGNKGTLQHTYEDRRAVLTKLFTGSKTTLFALAQSRVVTTPEEVQDLFNHYMQERLEGIICKRLDSQYQAGARNFNWVKYKRVHEAGLVDTIDCVVMGYYAGRGKRQQFGVGAFLVGVQGKGEQILTVAKIGTGLTDDQFRELYVRMQKVKTETMNSQYVVPKGLIPDFWVHPSIVVEIQSDEITKSPLHSAGYALRFPRLLKFRDDKRVADITTAQELASLFSFTE